MSDTHPLSEIATGRTDADSTTSGEGSSTTLPDEPTHEHPRHYAREANRLRGRLDTGEVTLDELGAREYGLLAYWHPSVVSTHGGETA